MTFAPQDLAEGEVPHEPAGGRSPFLLGLGRQPRDRLKEPFARFDTVLLGRKAYEAARKQGGGGMPGMKSYVFSTTLGPADCPGATLSKDPGETVRVLKRQAGKAIWLFGGGSLFRSLLELGLVDQLQLGIFPLQPGDGLPLVEHPATRARQKLAKHRVYPKTGTVLPDYEVVTRPTGSPTLVKGATPPPRRAGGRGPRTP